ncbi:glycosyl transferase [Erwinia sp. OLTSP20]|uniref:glycosyltransferase family 2 protein n=1 Tax=unclassified Erwinia TaxID=2622719 RepID=UPI000C182326|nr:MULTISPECIES: glycosyltransferase [unclassified Erwinia]PIJ49660.1 glycosyl transferase [Erwinia sp. OAMSP11]PIJ70075.1 glycosyl transferase [Erwinia sp. OLSSP12]PIJ80572.1 glycosyl transferase [Erwinia sp. OLCASP19]PIJ82737.1 glycosyl transferase [Erwinia sp. OLMTSP26]PIJ84814.1 glycosyl transferase [Erwinia sp. OLMDSP33]
MQQHAHLLSVIIPFYNDERYITDCLISLFEQIDNQVQVVLVDDGSSDTSNALVAGVISKYPDIQVSLIHQSNQGIAMARNAGLKQASGKFIAFLDADDRLSENYYALIKPVLCADQDDLIDFDYQRFSDSPPETIPGEKAQRIPYDFATEGLACLTPLFTRSMWHLWNRIYRKSLLAGEHFEPGRRYEDVIFAPFQYLKTQKIAHLNNTLYYYRDNAFGITRNIKKSDIDDIHFALNKMIRYVATHGNDPQLRRLAAGMLLNCFNEIKNMTKAVYGFYRYDAAVKRDIKIAASICQGSGIASKKVLQMRFPQVDTVLSALRLAFKKSKPPQTRSSA